MTVKKTESKSKSKKKVKSPKKKNPVIGDDSGIVIVEDDLDIDKEAEMEARKAYLEEARSQEAVD